MCATTVRVIVVAHLCGLDAQITCFHCILYSLLYFQAVVYAPIAFFLKNKRPTTCCRTSTAPTLTTLAEAALSENPVAPHTPAYETSDIKRRTSEQFLPKTTKQKRQLHHTSKKAHLAVDLLGANGHRTGFSWNTCLCDNGRK